MPRVSVIIPAYNAASFIGSTLESVVAQTFADWEVIVVDDGSSDGTGQIVADFLREKGITGTCVMQKNAGIAGARNAAIAKSRGELLAFLDHDDRWYPDKLKQTVAVFNAHPEIGLVCHDEHITQDGVVLSTKHYGSSTADLHEALIFNGNCLSTSAVVVKRIALDQAGLFDEDPAVNLAEDYELWIRLSRVARVHFLHEILGEYRLAANYATKRIEAHHQALLTVLDRHFQAHSGSSPGWRARLRIRKHRARIYRAASRAFLKAGDGRGRQWRYVGQALWSYPLDIKAWAIGALCLVYPIVNSVSVVSTITNSRRVSKAP